MTAVGDSGETGEQLVERFDTDVLARGTPDVFTAPTTSFAAVGTSGPTRK